MEMRKEQHTKPTGGLSDEQIIEGLRNRDPQITSDYFYGVCRIAYHIYNKRYELDWKVGLDFYSIAHEYYLSLDKHDFRQLEDRKPSMTLKSWMINGFRFVLLDRLKNYNKEHRLQSFEERMEKASLRFDVPDNNFSEDFRNTVYEICSDVLGRDHRSSIILQMMLIEGFKGKEVAADKEFDTKMPVSASPLPFSIQIPPTMEKDYSNRITPEYITSLKPNEIFVFGSNLAGMHGGGAARMARLYFGAVLGNGDGPQGQSYAIPTMQGGVETIRPYVDKFISYAKAHPEQTFLVTPIGCGIAGFTPDDISPLFEDAISVENIHLPQSFWEDLV